MIIDGTGMILGRASSAAAKALMEGTEVQVINVEAMIITGSPNDIVEDYMQKRRLQQKATPEYSPKWPKQPHLMVRRIIRGMLPFKKAKGKAAFRKLRVHIGNPGVKGEKMKLDFAKATKAAKFITVGELCKRLGASW
jgi:large subunit ribosomal protein L13